VSWLRRERAPLSEKAWKAVDDAVVMAARHVLAGRRVADLDGPHGWDYVGVRLGTMRGGQPTPSRPGVTYYVPDVALLTELRAHFTLPWTNVEAFERGGPALETENVEAAAREVALAEDDYVFGGFADDAKGLLEAAGSPRLPLRDWARSENVVADVLAAVERLDRAGVPGPYALVLDPGRYYAYRQAGAADAGYPAAKHLARMVAEVNRSAVVRGGALVSTRGGDFILTLGGDLSVGYLRHDDQAVHLFCVESLAFQLRTPEAVCVLGRAETRGPITSGRAASPRRRAPRRRG
jgi:uncharacterized linocin/CFP29 family protein